MTYDLSVLIPSIRSHLLEGVYNSIEKSFHGSWEMIIVSPYPLPKALEGKDNILYIKDAGTPIRARQIGLVNARGLYICYAADDVEFYPEVLDMAFKKLEGEDYKTVILGKYVEGDEVNAFMRSDKYYYLSTHDLLRDVMLRIPRGDKYWLINTGLISTQLMKEIGGFDCQFEACAMACVDLSIRLQNYGVKVVVQQEPFFRSTHLPGVIGDHEPIHNAQVSHDQPMFMYMYLVENSDKRAVIDLDNWKYAPEWWERRFGRKE